MSLAQRSPARYGNLELLKWAIEGGCPWDPDTTSEAARRGHLNVLEWVVQKGCPWYPTTFLVAADQAENMEILQWMRDHQDQIPQMKFNFKEIGISAIQHERLPLLAWCVEEGGFPLNEETWKLAAEQKSLNVMKWLWEKNVSWPEKVFDIAWENKSRNVLEWFFSLVPHLSVGSFGKTIKGIRLRRVRETS